MLKHLFANHVLANLTFALVLLMGTLSYLILPREQDPTVNFNWIDITTIMPGASAEDMEKRVTEVLEEAVRKVSDIKFVSSNSRESVSSILVRFEDIDERLFDKRVNDLRREIQNKQSELPSEAEDPRILEITSANAFPTATLVVTGPADDENLRRQAEIVKKDVEHLRGVDQILDSALHQPELQVNFIPQRLEALGLSPADLADTVTQSFRDVSAGALRVGEVNWLVQLHGAVADPVWLASLPVLTPRGEVRLGDLAEVVRAREKPIKLVRYEGQPAVMLAVTKKGSANTIDLVGRLHDYIDSRNAVAAGTGVQLVLVDDQTEITRKALSVMENNAVIGLLLVLLVSWVFLGSRIAFLVTIGIPFSLAGTFWALRSMGQTLNVSVLLGVVIALGMLVDDAVVVVEGIYYRVQRGLNALDAAVDSLREVFAPVTTSVLTTISAFLPLMLLPGILGKYMMIIPMVVTIALAVSLLEAYWMIPAHVAALNLNFNRPSRLHAHRVRLLHAVRLHYTRLLIRVMRYPKIALGTTVLLFVLAVMAVGAGMVKFNFFASDPLRVFYANVEMPVGTPLDKTLEKALEIEAKLRAHIKPEELQSMVSYAGQMFTETAPFQGEHYGQVFIALKPSKPGLRDVDEVIEAARADVMRTPGPIKLSFTRLSGGPPTSKPISIKVRGDELSQIRAAAADLENFMRGDDRYHDITDDDSPGQMELRLMVDQDAARRAGVSPLLVTRALRLFIDGEVVASMQDGGQELDVRVRAKPHALESIDGLLNETLPAADGRRIPLGELLHTEPRQGLANTRHYNFRRTITVESDIDKARIDTVEANRLVREEWARIQTRYPDIALDYSGELDDIQESIDSIGALFLLGLGLIYLILGTQFKSYFQPLMIISTVPMAFTGVTMGLLITQNPLSLFTLYGVVALAGIAVNSAIVLISAANDRLEAGMSLLHATLYAARRRVIPILITSLTTIAGLFSLASGLGGKSLLWGPVATAIVWGLAVSTLLTLFVIPVLYRLSMGRAARRLRQAR